MQLNPYLSFNGKCIEAIKFYEKVLGAKLAYKQTWGESPMADQMPKEAHNQIIHASLEVAGSTLMCSDAPPDRYEVPKGIGLTLNFSDAAEGERVFNALAEGGSTDMPFQATYWSSGFGMCRDRFGIPWMVNCDTK